MSSRLDLKVVLSTIDKALEPIRAITKGSAALSEALQNNKQHLKTLDKQQSDIRGYRIANVEAIKQARAIRDLDVKSRGYSQALEEQRAKHTNLGANLKAAQTQYNRLTKAMFDGKGGTAEFQRELQKSQVTLLASRQAFDRSAASIKTYQGRIRHADDRIQQLNHQQKTSQERLAGLKTRLETAGIGTDRLRGKAQNLRIEQERMNKTLTEQNARLKKVAAQQQRMAAARSQYDKTQQFAGSMAGVGAGATAAGAAMGMPVLGLVKSYMTFEDAMAGVAKQVESARDDNGRLTETYYQIAEAIKEISTRIPMATTEIAALIEGGARMGIQGQRELLKFAEVAANAATAFELPADKIGEDLARIAGLFKIPINELDKLGDVINYLDDNSLAKGSDLIESMTRLSDIADKMDFRDVAAFSGTFLNIGRQADTAATATRAMVRELANARMRGKTFQQGMKMLGLSSDKIQKRMSHDATGTLLEVLEKLKGVRADQQMEVAERLFGKQFGKDASALSQNLEMLREQLRMTRSTDAEGSMQREADIRSELLSARLEMARNRASSLAATMGATLQPVLIELIENFNNVAGRVMGWVSANPELTGQILKTVAGIGILTAGFGALTLAMASILGPFAVIRYAMTVFGIKSFGVIGMLKGLGAGFGFVRVLATGFFRLMFGFIRANPIAALVIGVAAAIYDLAARWEQIKSYFNAGEWMKLAGAVMQGLEAGLNAATLGLYGVFKKIIVGLVDVFRNLLGINSPSRLFTDFGGMIMDGLINGIKNKLNSVKEVITGVGSSLTGWFKDTLGIRSPSRVFAALGGHTIDGLALGIQAQEDGPLKRISELGKKLTAAAGLSIPLLAGAAEPLQFDNRPPLQSAAGASAASGGNTYSIQITVHGTADTNSLAAEVRKQIEAFEREKAVRQRSRLGDY